MRRELTLAALAGLTAVATASTAGASWRSSYLMGPNQGYCKRGNQIADVRDCPENQKGGATRRPKNDQRQPAQFSEPDN
jgi:hypothetical protein